MPSIREALADSYDQHTTETPEPVVEASAATEAPEAGASSMTAAVPVESIGQTDTKAEASAKARDEMGRFAPKGKPAAQPAAVGAASAAASVGQGEAAGVNPPAPAVSPVVPDAPKVPEVKAPQSFRPAAREKWATVPAEVQQEVIRRERETARALQEAADDRKQLATFREAVAPFEQTIRARGGDLLSNVQQLLQTQERLNYAPPADRAKLIAEIIEGYGIDPRMVGAWLQGQQPQEQEQRRQPQVNPEQLVEQALEWRIAAMQEQRAQREYSETLTWADKQGIPPETREQMATLIEELAPVGVTMTAQAAHEFIAKHEFSADVIDDIPLIMQAAAKRGVALTVDDAYSKAVRMHPELETILKQREAAKNAPTATAATARARAASSSVKSSPAAAVGGTAQPTSIRAILEEQMQR